MTRLSLRGNVILSGIQRMFSIIFPLITFPYISRKLNVDTIGSVNYVQSIISYFVLIAGLGISNYAIREGAKLKDDKKKLEQFCAEIFTINMIATLFAYILFILIYILVPSMQEYTPMLFIYSLTIIGTTIGINWLYSIFEDYIYITIRTIIFQILSLILLFCFVKTDQDGVKYIGLITLSAVGSNILNFIHSKKYIDLRLTTKINLKKHIKPIMLLFASAIAVSIYINSDVTILGWLKGDYEVGIYSISVKFYNIIKQIIAAMIMVTLPRVSGYLGRNEIEKYTKTLAMLYDFLIAFAIPLVIGIIMVADLLVVIVAGEKYMESIIPLQILAVSLFFASLGILTNNAILLPNRYDKIQFIATILSAIINIVLNFILIPFLGVKAAALTTMISELIVFSMQIVSFKRNDKNNIFNSIFKLKIKNIISILLGCVLIIIEITLIRHMSINIVTKLILNIVLSVIIYIVTLIIFKSNGLDFIKGMNIENL